MVFRNITFVVFRKKLTQKSSVFTRF
jgi:hypothetical protein